jgi:hypothetical protein
LWNNIYTNKRGKTLEEFIIINDLLVMNEKMKVPTFESNSGRSWIDLTICNNILAQNIRRWTCGEEESCSDHKIILFDIEGGISSANTFNHTQKQYLTKAADWGKFANLVSNMQSGFNCLSDTSDLTQCDQELGEIVKQHTNIDWLVEKYTSIVTETCSAVFKVSRAGNRVTKGTSVPWWTSELTVLRKRTLALRRRYQRTTNNNALVNRENSVTKLRSDNTKQNSKKKSLNLGKTSAPKTPTPTRGVRLTNWRQGNCKIKQLYRLSKHNMEPTRWT